ncbi:glycosyltransferase family 4 protein [Anatilimnocola sp. NA78]|uniref:glycosyltransferase family 4 protein n=1 Tax=Anatilimnocola sp. NA78 TaxID=3415683 RepID=UPI003CE59DFB
MSLVLESRDSHPAIRAKLPVILHTRVVTGQGGGPEKTILNSPRFLPPLGYQAICAYMRSPSDEGFQAIRDRASGWQAPLVEIDDRGPLDIGVFRQCLQVCRENNVAIWHGHDYKSNLIGLWVSRYWPMRLVTTLHGWVKFTYKTPLYYAIDRWCLRYYEKIICVSDDLLRTCLDWGLPADRFIYIENAIDTEQFCRRQSRESARASLGLDPSRKIVLAVGRLSPEKGFDVLIRAFASLSQQQHPSDLVIAGEGDDRTRLTALIEELGVGDRVKLLGFRSDTTSLYEAADIFVLSSYREGLPNVVLEAMAMETPVIATRVAGVPKLISAGETGLLFDAGDKNALAVHLASLLESGEFRERLSKAARATIEQQFSFHRRMEKVAQVYDDVLARNP